MIPGSPIETEWNFYRRQRERLIAEGHEGRHVLIKGEEVLGSSTRGRRHWRPG